LKECGCPRLKGQDSQETVCTSDLGFNSLSISQRVTLSRDKRSFWYQRRLWLELYVEVDIHQAFPSSKLNRKPYRHHAAHERTTYVIHLVPDAEDKLHPRPFHGGGARQHKTSCTRLWVQHRRLQVNVVEVGRHQRCTPCVEGK